MPAWPSISDPATLVVGGYLPRGGVTRRVAYRGYSTNRSGKPGLPLDPRRFDSAQVALLVSLAPGSRVANEYSRVGAACRSEGRISHDRVTERFVRLVRLRRPIS